MSVLMVWNCIAGAVVKLQCNNTKYKLVETSKSDKNGYFYFEAPKSITTYGAHKCNVVLVGAPYGLKPSNLHSGVTGAVLRPEKPFLSKKLPFVLYTVGPLAFEPKCKNASWWSVVSLYLNIYVFSVCSVLSLNWSYTISDGMKQIVLVWIVNLV